MTGVADRQIESRRRCQERWNGPICICYTATSRKEKVRKDYEQTMNMYSFCMSMRSIASVSVRIPVWVFWEGGMLRYLVGSGGCDERNTTEVGA